jgi:glycosidase
MKFLHRFLPHKNFWILWIVPSFFWTCHHGDPTPVQTEPQQYGTPLANVPSAPDLVLYEANIRAMSSEGNFQGVIDRLDKIKAMGVNTLWLMPIYPVGQLRSVGELGSPYCVKDYFSVNSEFGDLAKLRELVDQAHQRKMAVILDWVANHTSWDNAWITNKSWYTQDGNGNIISPAGTNWNDVADLNYDNADMRKAMIAAMKYWVLEANVDGFRCDVADLVPFDFWTDALNQLKALPNRHLIFLAEGSSPEDFNSGFQLNYAWDYYGTLTQIYGSGLSASAIYSTQVAEYGVVPAGSAKMRFTTNHDFSASATPVVVFGGISGALSASVITIFSGGAPLIYSGQEVGRTLAMDIFKRDPINWNVNTAMEQQYEKLLTLYSSSPTVKTGTLTWYLDNNIAAFSRTSGQDTYLFLVNVRNTQQSYFMDPVLQQSTWTNVMDNTTVSLVTVVTLDAYGWMILKK